MIKINEEKIKEILERGVHEIFEKESLQKKLLSGKLLRVKFGIDPTASALHLGHAAVLRKLRQFQDAGNKIILLIGDFTAMIGDPSGRSSNRPALNHGQVKKNMKDYIKQAGKILDMRKTEIRYNTEWYKKMGMKDFYEMASIESVQQLMNRSMFKERLEKEELLTLSEFTYPLLQGYDSVMLKCDVEIGGEDQIFNMLHGRKVQKRYGMPEQDVLTVPLLEGTDGIKKMSKSLGNYIGLNDMPQDMYGKIMAILDTLIDKYAELLTDINIEEIKKMPNPRDQKAMLAKEIVKIYHGEKEAQKAEEEFDKVFRNKEVPTDMEIFETDKKNYPVLDLLFDAKLAESKNEAKRLVEGSGVSVIASGAKQSQKIQNWREDITIEDGMVIQCGKRKFVKIRLK